MWVGVQVLVYSGRTVYFWQRDQCSRWVHIQTVHMLQIFHTAVASELVDAEAGLSVFCPSGLLRLPKGVNQILTMIQQLAATQQQQYFCQLPFLLRYMCIEFHWCKCNCRGRGRRFETSGTRYNEIWWSNRPQDHSTANFGALSLCSHRSPIDYPLKPKDARRFLQKTVSQF